jgi:hypothetical protein
VNHTNCQHGTEINIIHQEWKIYEPYQPSSKGSLEKKIEQKPAHDGLSCSFEDERSNTDYLGDGEIG